MTQPIVLFSTVRRIFFAAALFTSVPSLFAATIVWSGASGAGTNWSTGGNWIGGTAPTASDDVKFFDAGATTTILSTNSLVDVSQSVIGIQFGQTNNHHLVGIAAGQTLTVNGGNFIVGSTADLGVAKNLTNGFAGIGGTLIYSNPVGVVAIQQGSAAAVTGTRGNLNLSGLDTFQVTALGIGLGSTAFVNPGNAVQREAGQLILARTNIINLTLTDTLQNYNLATRTNAIELSRNPGNNAAILSLLVLGQSNVFNVDSMAFGRDKASASSAGVMVFNTAFTNNNPVAIFRGAAGGNSRVTWWALGDMNASASSTQVSVGTNDFQNGTVDARIETLVLGRDCSPSHTATAQIIGTFLFNNGRVDANTVVIANQALGPAGSTAPIRGSLLVSTTNATLVVNSNLVLGSTTQSSTAAANSSGVLNIFGGSVLANNITVGSASLTNIINLAGAGSLTVSNAIATPARALTFLNITNGTLRFNVTGLTNAVVGTVNSGGTSNLIHPFNVAVFPTYPRQVTLIKYTNANILGPSGYNFALTNVPASAPGAYLINNTANASVDLMLPFDPRPVIVAQPASYSGNPGDNVSFSVSINGNSVAPLIYQWFLGSTPLVNGATGNGSTISGATSASLAINNAQPGDNGSYTVVISNAYGSATSAPPAVLTISAGNVAPSLSGPNNQIVIQGNNATFSASVAGNPAPTLQWRRNGADIVGATSTTYTLTNAQYPTDDGAVFSLVATNAAGAVTNSATLTVIVPPTISVQPVSLVVTNTQAASFSVTATGVPTPGYQWLFNGNPIFGATNSTYNIASATSANIGSYAVAVTNTAGSITSSNAILTVNSLMAITTLSPANASTGAFVDTALTITFNQPVSFRAAGNIRIYNLTNPTTPVDTINAALGASQARTFPGDSQAFNSRFIITSGNSATIYPRFNVLNTNQSYFVTIDGGVFTDTNGAWFSGIQTSNVWNFATKLIGAADPVSLVVAADGSGDFLTVQGAVNSVPASNTTPTLLNIRNGFYNELVNISGKHNLTLRGQSRDGTVIFFPNNSTNQIPVNGGSTQARMSFKVNANDIALDSLTISNSTGQGGSQAEALMINTSARRCVVFNSVIASRQDTILANVNSSQAYFYKSIIRGNFDYIWGGGNLFFDQCTIVTIAGTGGGQLTAARTDTSASTSTNFPWLNPAGSYTANGMSFVNCSFTSEPGLGNITLAGSNGTGGNNVSWFGCDFATNYVAPSASLFSGNYVFWQAQNTSNGVPVTYPVLTTLSGNDARLLAATNIPVWFYGWNPQLAPNILTNPLSQTVNYAAPATFNVAATGIPAPTYQWQLNGTNLPAATAATLNLASATLNDAGSYRVIVSTTAGSVTSSVATLTVNPQPNSAPVFTAPSAGTNFTLNVGFNFAANCTATDSDTPAQTLTYALLAAPSGVTLNSTNGNLAWRPLTSQGDSTNTVTVKVTDDGIPNLSATNTFTLTVNALTSPTVNAAAYAGGQFSLNFSGQIGPDYALQATTNLIGAIWVTIATTNSPASMPVQLTDPNAGSQPVQFYRLVTGPPLP